MKKLNNTLAILAASLVLSTPFVAQAQTDQQMDGQFNRQVHMKMANKQGMISKEDFMKTVSDKFDKMQTNGMISVDDMGKLLRDIYRGR
ncbi:MAG TPA: hypothetical protein VGJ72_20825 [Polaromonas sp.]|jgi:hypothetical protein